MPDAVRRIFHAAARMTIAAAVALGSSGAGAEKVLGAAIDESAHKELVDKLASEL